MSKMLKIASIKKRIRQLKKFAADDEFSNTNGGIYYPPELLNLILGATAAGDMGYGIDRWILHPDRARQARLEAEQAANRARYAAEQEVTNAGRAAGEAFDTRRRNAPFGDLEGLGAVPETYGGILGRAGDYLAENPTGPADLPTRGHGEYPAVTASDFIEAQGMLRRPNVTDTQRMQAWAIMNQYLAENAREPLGGPGIALDPEEARALRRWSTGRTFDENLNLQGLGRPSDTEIPADILDRELQTIAQANARITGEHGTRGRLPFAENGRIVWDTPENVRRRQVAAAEDAVRQRQLANNDAGMNVNINPPPPAETPTYFQRVKRTGLPILAHLPAAWALSQHIHNRYGGESSAEKLPDWAVNLPPLDTTSTNTPSVKP